MASIPSFIFGGNTKYKTQEELEAAREQVKAMLGDIGHSGLTGWGSALADLGKGIGARIDQSRINEGQEFLTGEQAKLAEMFGFGGGGAGSDVLAGGGGADSMAGGVGGDSGGRVSEDAIRQGLIDRGLPPHVAEGFVMNMKDESGLRTDIREGKPNVHGTRGFGLYQATGPREVALRKFAQARGTSPTDLATNLDFLIYEGQTTEKAAFDRILNTRTPGEAGAAIVSNFLRPAKKHEIARRNKYLSTDLSGGGGSNVQAGGGAGDSFLQAKPNRRRMTPAMLEQEANTEARPLWAEPGDLHGRRRMTPAMTGIPDAVQPVPPVVPAPSPLDDRRRMTPAMINPQGSPAPVPAPIPAPNPDRFGGPVLAPAPAPLQAPNPDRFAPAAFVPPAPRIYSPPADTTGDRPRMTPPPPIPAAMFNPAPMGPQQSFQPRPPARAVVPGQSMAGMETAPSMPAPRPAPAPAPAPAVVKVDPFTDMILGDQASKFRPGNVSATPPAETARGLAAARQLTPFGANVFPAAPPAPGTPAAAGFGVPQEAMAGGGGSSTQVGGAGADRMQGGGDKIAKLQFILASPYASKEQKLMAGSMIEREYALEDERRKAAADAADPLNKLKLREAELQVEKLEGEGDIKDVVVVGKRLYNKKTGEWIDPPAGEDGGPFDSTSVEGQALNGLVKSGKLTVEQAYDLASGKTVLDPKTGAVLFFTGTELMGGQPGQPPQPIDPNAPAAAPAAPQPNAPAAAPPAQAPATPRGGRVLTEGEPEKPPVNTRWIDENDHSKGVEPIPGSSAEQMPAELAARIGLAKDALKQLPSVRKKIVEGGATGIWDWFKGVSGGGSQGHLHRELGAASEALVRMLTGAGMNESEARDEAYMYLPQIQDDAPTLTDKLDQLERRLKATVEQAEKGRVSPKAEGEWTVLPNGTKIRKKS